MSLDPMHIDADQPHTEAGAVKTILNLGEERLGVVVNQLLSNGAFVTAVSSAISGSLAAKRSVDKGLHTVFGALNLPTVDDVEKLRKRLAETEEALAVLSDKLTKLDAQLRK